MTNQLKPSNPPREITKVDKRTQAVELIAFNPGITNNEIATRLQLNRNTISAWRNNAKFNELVYERFMDKAQGDIPEVVLALLAEAKNGNVRAAELVLKHFGKLQETLTIKLESPFMQHMKSKELEFTDAEISEVDAVDIGTIPESIPLPPVDPKANEKGAIAKEERKLYSTIKKKKNNKDQNSRYMLRKRAKEVGLAPLPPRKPTKTERAKWIAKLEELETKKGVK
jgi:hypothetical protein